MDQLFLSREQCRKYLDRIGVSGDVEVSYEFLALLLRRHRESIVFENLDTYLLGRPADLDVESVYKKIVCENRGGYCFERSIAFLQLLKGLGFDAYLCGCKLRSMDHHVNHGSVLVRLGDDICYCDVGLGCDIPPEPVRLIPGWRKDPQGFSLSVEEAGPFWWKYSFSPGLDIYICRDRYCIDDFKPLNQYMTTNPGKFRDNVILFKNTSDGYISLIDCLFKRRIGDKITEKNVTKSERNELIKSEFDINILITDNA